MKHELAPLVFIVALVAAVGFGWAAAYTFMHDDPNAKGWFLGFLGVSALTAVMGFWGLLTNKE